MFTARSPVASLANDERNYGTRRTDVDVPCWSSWPSLPLCFVHLFCSFYAVKRCDIIMIEDEKLWLIVSSNVSSKVFHRMFHQKFSGPMGCIMILLLETNMISQIAGYQVHKKWKNMNITHFEMKTEVLWYSSENSGFTVKSNNCRMLHFTTSPWVLSYAYKGWWINIEALLTKYLGFV